MTSWFFVQGSLSTLVNGWGEVGVFIRQHYSYNGICCEGQNKMCACKFVKVPVLNCFTVLQVPKVRVKFSRKESSL